MIMDEESEPLLPQGEQDGATAAATNGPERPFVKKGSPNSILKLDTMPTHVSSQPAKSKKWFPWFGKGDLIEWLSVCGFLSIERERSLCPVALTNAAVLDNGLPRCTNIAYSCVCGLRVELYPNLSSRVLVQ